MPSVAKTRSALYLTSSFAPEKCRHYDQFLAGARKHGWNQANLQALMRDLKQTITEFEHLSGSTQKLRLILKVEVPEMKDKIIRVSGNEILINLAKGPELVSGLGAHNLSYLLVERLFEDGHPVELQLMFEGIEATPLFDYAIDAIVEFYINERQAKLNVTKLRQHCYKLLCNTGIETVYRKLAYQLFRLRAFSGRELEGIIDVLVAEIRETVNKSELGISEFQSLNSISQLAIFATLAKKAGNTAAYLKCHDLLYGQTARAMAWIEFAQIEVAEVEDIPKNSYPASATHKVELTTKGYRLLFNTFQRVAEYYYDNVEVA
ncbi:hypothetical protein ACFL37_02445 [Candidatus Margulisiibacteriota bacterium]